MNPVSALLRFVAEFRRRRLFRATAIYLAAAFVVLQLGDLVVAPLGLPSWTMGLLIVIVAAGFLLTLALAWTFDLTPEGVRRTRPADAGADDGAVPPRRAPARSSRRTVAAVAVVGTAAAAAVIGLAGGGWLGRAALWRAAPDDAPAAAVAVLPFRVAGATGDLGYMREGMVDLLTAMLSERAGMATVSPRQLLRELRDGDGLADAPDAGTLRRLGAARYVTGEVVGRADRLTITAALHEVKGGPAIRASVSGSEQELDRLVDRLAAQLLAGGIAGRDGGGGGLEEVPVAALREYLEGLSQQRSGRFGESLPRFRRALDIDSTFAQAALAFVVSAAWARTSAQEWNRVASLAWTHRQRLSGMDRLQLEGTLGPDYPELSAPAARLRVVENAVAAMPDRAELWVLYGDILFHEGQAMGAPDWPRRTISAFKRARSLAPDNPEAEYHLLDLALMLGDTAMLREVADRLIRRDTVGDLRPHVHGTLAVHENSPEAWRTWRASFATGGNQSLVGVAWRALYMARGIEEVLAVARELESAAVTPFEASAPRSVQIQLLASSGRPAEAMRVAERLLRGPAARTETLQLTAWVGFAWDGDTTAGRQALEALRTTIDAEQARPVPAPTVPFHVCTVAAMDLMQGRADWAASAVPWLEREAAGLDERFGRAEARTCGVVVQAGIAHLRGSREEARERLRALEAHLTGSHVGSARMGQAANLLAAHLHEAHDDLPAALAALQRLQDTSVPNLRSTALREEAQILDRLGRTDEAVTLYRHYLALRAHAGPEVQHVDDGVRRHLAALERSLR
jgi:tetratricopeptide (TPR) repeat protein